MSKTITDIIPPSRRRQLGVEQGGVPASMQSVPAAPPPPPRPVSDRPVFRGEPDRNGFPYVTAGIAAVAIIGSTALLFAYAQAKVTITPKLVSAPIQQEFTATLGDGQLPFELVTVEKTASASVDAETSENANDPATGTITILNAQAGPQTLIKNTRFESPEGLIYRIQESVTIPGGSPSAPGSVRATVYADMGGEQYNIGPASFTVPGLRGSAAYNLVTAKSDAPMEGGFAGTRASVSQGTRDREQERIKPKLAESLNEEVTKQLPEGYVVLPGATFISYAPARDSAGEDDQVNVNVRGTAVAVAMPEGAIASAIASSIQGDYSGEAVTLGTTEGLTLTPAVPGVPAPDLASFTFTLSGTANVLWTVDTGRIASTVAGKDRDAAFAILQGFPEVGSAVLALRPPWRQAFPDDPSEIAVATTTPSGAGE